MKKKTTIKLGALLLILAIMMSSLAGISAYFTDTDTATNTFTVGEVSIDLQEPNWNGDTDITPNMTTAKDPQVLNDGASDAFVFLEVVVPYRDNIVIADADGTKNVAATAELFTYTIKDGWVEVGTPTTDAEAGVVKHVYAYIGDNTSDLKALAANETTPTLFDEITFVNAVENQGLENQELDVVINAYGIQTNDINGGKTDPAGVWEVVMNRYNVEVTDKILIGYSYNGEILPEIPATSEDYPYVYIVKLTGENLNSELALIGMAEYIGQVDAGYYLQYTTHPRTHEWNNDSGYYNLRLTEGKMLTYGYFEGLDDWLFGGSYDYEASGYTAWKLQENIQLVWCNNDVLREDGSIYLAASEPMPVYE